MTGLLVLEHAVVIQPGLLADLGDTSFEVKKCWGSNLGFGTYHLCDRRCFLKLSYSLVS